MRMLQHDIRHFVRRISGPSDEDPALVSVEELLFFLDMEDVRDHDFVTHLEDHIEAAVTVAEHDARRSFAYGEWELNLDSFPSEIELRRPPVESVESVKYIDTTGVQQTLEVEDYQVDLATEPPRIRPATGTSWPRAKDVLNAVTVRFIAGYEAPSDLPKLARQAILFAAKSFYLGCEQGEEYWRLVDRLRWGGYA